MFNSLRNDKLLDSVQNSSSLCTELEMQVQIFRGLLWMCWCFWNLRWVCFPLCLARHCTRFILLVYHGDDFVVLGGQVDLMWFHDSLSRHMTVKMRGIMSLDSGNFIKEIRLLNRIIIVGFDEACGLPHLDWEADSRRCEIL